MSLHGLDTNSSTDVDQFYSLLGEPLARTDAAVVFIDHVTKSSENRGKGPIGSQHKRARVSGASYEVSALQTIAPGRAGQLKLKIDKDRLGAVRSIHPTLAGTFHLDSTSPDRSIGKVIAPDTSPGPFRHTLAMQHVSEALEQVGDEGLSRRGIEDIGGFSKETLMQAVDELIEDGHVAREKGHRGTLLHRLVRPYRAVTTVPEQRSTSNMSPAPSPVSPTVPEGPGTVIGTDDERHVPGPRRFIGGGRGTDDESDRRDTPPGAQEVPLQ